MSPDSRPDVSKECHIDLQKIARFANAALVHTEAIGIDVEKRVIHCKDGRPPVRYDVLSIDIGSTPKFVESQVSPSTLVMKILDGDALPCSGHVQKGSLS